MNPFFNVYTFLYLFFILLFVIFRCYGIINNRSERSNYIFFFFILLYIVSAFRGNTVGGDLVNYLRNFHELSFTPFAKIFKLYYSNYEIGYTFLIKCLTLISSNERVYFLITPILSLFGIYYLIKNFSPIPIISVLVYIGLGFYTNSFNNVRQSIAIGIVCLSFPYLVNRRFSKFAICVLLASLFHTSAIFYMVIYPFTRINLTTKKFYLILILGSVFFFLLGIKIFNYFRDYIFVAYSTSNAHSLLESNRGYSLLGLYFCITLFVFHVYRRLLKKSSNKRLIILFNVFVVEMLFATMSQAFATQMATFTRMSIYFYVNIILIIPYYLRTIRYEQNRLICILICIIVLFLYMSIMVYAYVPAINSNSQGVLPYVLCL